MLNDHNATNLRWLTKFQWPRFALHDLVIEAQRRRGVVIDDDSNTTPRFSLRRLPLQRIGAANIPKLYKALEFFGFETGAFEQLTNKYMTESFNPRTPDSPDVRYFSYGAQLNPHLTSVFRKSHNIVMAEEGPNDGLVSVQSSQWGEYKGTLDNVSHLDLINWTNRLRVGII